MVECFDFGTLKFEEQWKMFPNIRVQVAIRRGLLKFKGNHKRLSYIRSVMEWIIFNYV